MVKRVVWTNTAKKARREILEYWTEHNGSNTYSKKLAQLFRIKAALLQTGPVQLPEMIVEELVAEEILR